MAQQMYPAAGQNSLRFSAGSNLSISTLTPPEDAIVTIEGICT